MLKLFKIFFDKLLFDDKAAARWLRGGLLGFAGSGMVFAEQLSTIIPGNPAIEKIKIAAVISVFLGGMVTAGDKNPTPGA